MDDWEGLSSVDAEWHCHLMPTGQVSAVEHSQHAISKSGSAHGLLPGRTLALSQQADHSDSMAVSRELYAVTKQKFNRPIQLVH